MKCKVLVLTHSDLAEAFVKTVQLIMGSVELLTFKNLPASFDIESYKGEIEAILEENKETGILVITDLLGGSPFLNCSQVIQKHWGEMELITGCNLPMLLAVADVIEEKSVAELKEIALEAGQNGIVDLKKQVKEAGKN